MNFVEFCERIAHLRVDRGGGVPKPYKPILLAAVTILIGKGEIRSRGVLLDGGVRSVYFQLLKLLYPNWPFQADIRMPYRHLETDGVWKLLPVSGALERLEAGKALHAKARDVLKHVACAELDAAVFKKLSQSSEARREVLEVLSRAYFPPGAAEALLEAGSLPIDPPPTAETPATLTERALEEHLCTHWSATPFPSLGVELDSPGRQVMTPVNCIDLLGIHEGRGESWVFELKKGRPADRVVGQLQRYMGWIASHRGRPTLGAVIAGDSDSKLRYAVKANPNVKLWIYDEDFRLRPDER